MANSIFDSFAALVNSDINIRKAEISALQNAIEAERKEFEAKVVKIQARQIEIEKELIAREGILLQEELVRSSIEERELQLKALRLSEEVIQNTVLQIMSEDFGLAFTGTVASVNAPALARVRESKEALQARVLANLATDRFITVKELAEKLDKNGVQINTVLNSLVDQKKVLAQKAQGSRTILYKLV